MVSRLDVMRTVHRLKEMNSEAEVDLWTGPNKGHEMISSEEEMHTVRPCSPPAGSMTRVRR
eukprot:9014528-Pyramimonas_sp.AAC.1